MVIQVECYFDESIGTATLTRPDGNRFPMPILCVAGYLIESEQARALRRDWQAVLDQFGIAFFRMSDCAHGNGPFKGMNKRRCVEIEARMIGNIKRRTVKGFAISVNVDQYEQFMPVQNPLAGSAYNFCVNGIINSVSMWIDQTKFSGHVSYFFEAGHASQREANALMDNIFRIPELREMTRYSSHAFMDKKLALPLQAADLLAWQFYTDIRRQTEGHTAHRKDFDSLINHPHQVTFVTPKIMTDIARGWGYDTSEAERILAAEMGSDYPKTGKMSDDAVRLWQRRRT